MGEYSTLILFSKKDIPNNLSVFLDQKIGSVDMVSKGKKNLKIMKSTNGKIKPKNCVLETGNFLDCKILT